MCGSVIIAGGSLDSYLSIIRKKLCTSTSNRVQNITSIGVTLFFYPLFLMLC